MYSVGDLLIGIAPEGEYYITSKDCLVKVTKIYSSREIEVQVLKTGVSVPSSETRSFIGDCYSVHPRHFIPMSLNKGKEENQEVMKYV